MGDEKEVWANAVQTFSIYTIEQLGVRLGTSDISEGMTFIEDYKQSITLLTAPYIYNNGNRQISVTITKGNSFFVQNQSAGHISSCHGSQP